MSPARIGPRCWLALTALLAACSGEVGPGISYDQASANVAVVAGDMPQPYDSVQLDVKVTAPSGGSVSAGARLRVFDANGNVLFDQPATLQTCGDVSDGDGGTLFTCQPLTSLPATRIFVSAQAQDGTAALKEGESVRAELDWSVGGAATSIDVATSVESAHTDRDPSPPPDAGSCVTASSGAPCSPAAVPCALPCGESAMCTEGTWDIAELPCADAGAAD
jgi:hypothetical protein